MPLVYAFNEEAEQRICVYPHIGQMAYKAFCLQVMADLDGNHQADQPKRDRQCDDRPELLPALAPRLGGLPAFQLSRRKGLAIFRHAHLKRTACWRRSW